MNSNNQTTDLDQLERSLRAGDELDPEAWTRIRDDLAGRADAAGLVDVAFERHDSPLGTMLIGATGEGLVRVGLPVEGEDAVLAELAMRVSARVLFASRASVADARRQLDQYFAGRRRRFELELDWRLTKGFRRSVLLATARIPYGTTASYREVATEAGNPKAVRAAGSALAHNPLPILVPCHRVLRSGGELGSYLGGPEAKARLLELEGSMRV
ncbi:MAG: methylated-DNA--[protein]-cysteine S-methyltransferase [Solirubrobacterales bacterium]|nr:methylated-DNA--[protein]-cysteine S-methyltransferase [Solirubrobacterales bacterium]